MGDLWDGASAPGTATHAVKGLAEVLPAVQSIQAAPAAELLPASQLVQVVKGLAEVLPAMQL